MTQAHFQRIISSSVPAINCFDLKHVHREMFQKDLYPEVNLV